MLLAEYVKELVIILDQRHYFGSKHCVYLEQKIGDKRKVCTCGGLFCCKKFLKMHKVIMWVNEKKCELTTILLSSVKFIKKNSQGERL